LWEEEIGEEYSERQYEIGEKESGLEEEQEYCVHARDSIDRLVMSGHSFRSLKH
jgi:hypothetical protein